MITELEIINDMLASTGTAPLTSRDSKHPFFIKARNKLRLVNGAIQRGGWWYNTSTRTLNPSVEGEVILPSNTEQADPIDTNSRIVTRDGKLFDLDRNTSNIGAPVKVKLVTLVPLEQLPPEAAEYLRTRAVYEFYRDEDGAPPKLGEYKEARTEAWVLYKGAHLRNADVNIFKSPSIQTFTNRPTRRARRLPL